jgi:FKBP-type peptidyl-prolyl cis-trans isomerase
MPRRRLRITLLAVAVLAPACWGGSPEACVREPVASPSGLRYRDLDCGRGTTATRGHRVTVAYTTRLADGTPIGGADRSLSFPLGAGQVIAGWDEGIAGMRVGGVRRLTVPPKLAFGDGGFADQVPPGATLVFEVRLLRVAP